MAGDALTTLTVRLWLDTVEDLQAQAFASDTPSQRQQLFLDGKRLQDDGRVLVQHGVVAECTIQLVSARVSVILVGSALCVCCFECALGGVLLVALL